jgi:hypothetical protein
MQPSLLAPVLLTKKRVLARIRALAVTSRCFRLQRSMTAVLAGQAFGGPYTPITLAPKKTSS